jgi:hypothetical protein
VEKPASNPASREVDCLDLQGQRELLAGVELEKGEQAAGLARCTVERTALERWGQQEAKRADDAETRMVWVTALTGVGSAAVAAAITAVIEFVANAHRSGNAAGNAGTQNAPLQPQGVR